jgi:hypothetical protein
VIRAQLRREGFLGDRDHFAPRTARD